MALGNIKNQYVFRVLIIVFFGFAVSSQADDSLKGYDQKPDFHKILKPKTLQLIEEDLETAVHAGWEDNDFKFLNGVLVRAPFRITRERITNFSLYPQMSSAIKKMEYDPKTQIIEIVGEAGGLHMHSWVKADLQYKDALLYEIVRGDMVGFKVKAYLWEHGGKTLAIAEGLLPGAKQRFPGLVKLAFPTLAEIVLGVAMKNFRNFIEDEYNRKRVTLAR